MQRERSYSTCAEYLHLLAHPPRKHEPFVPRRESEAERTARLEVELQEEMSYHLDLRRNSEREGKTDGPQRANLQERTRKDQELPEAKR